MVNATLKTETKKMLTPATVDLSLDLAQALYLCYLTNASERSTGYPINTALIKAFKAHPEMTADMWNFEWASSSVLSFDAFYREFQQKYTFCLP